MSVFTHPEFRAHESVVHWHDAETGLRAILAVHSTTLGPALGGCRMWPYADEDAALRDALRLSRGMTYKAALADLGLGGGKSVILGDPRRDKSPALMRAMGRAVGALGGRYIAAEDSGTTVEDLRCMAAESPHVAGIAETAGWDGKTRSGDPSPATAYGCFVGIACAVRRRLGRESLAGVRVAIQGFGNVGRHLAQLLSDAGAALWVADLYPDQVGLAVRLFGAKAVAPEEIVAAGVDVFAPCALGAVLDDASIPRLKAKVVAGSANNQLAEPRHGAALAARDILYAPDYAINAGGLIDVASEHRGYDPAWVRRRLDGIGATLERIFERAAATGRPPHEVADVLAEQRLERARRLPRAVRPAA